MTFFNPPRQVETTIFTRLPEQFRKPRRTAWADANQGGREIDSFLEGPSFDREGRLYVTDIPYGRVFRVSVKGEWKLVARVRWMAERAEDPSRWPGLHYRLQARDNAAQSGQRRSDAVS